MTVSEDWVNGYVRKNTYWKAVRPLWFKRSTYGKEIIWPFQKAYIRGLKLPSIWQADRIEWFTEKDFTYLILKGLKIGGEDGYGYWAN